MIISYQIVSQIYIRYISASNTNAEVDLSTVNFKILKSDNEITELKVLNKLCRDIVDVLLKCFVVILQKHMYNTLRAFCPLVVNLE